MTDENQSPTNEIRALAHDIMALEEAKSGLDAMHEEISHIRCRINQQIRSIKFRAGCLMDGIEKNMLLVKNCSGSHNHFLIQAAALEGGGRTVDVMELQVCKVDGNEWENPTSTDIREQCQDINYDIAGYVERVQEVRVKHFGDALAATEEAEDDTTKEV